MVIYTPFGYYFLEKQGTMYTKQAKLSSQLLRAAVFLTALLFSAISFQFADATTTISSNIVTNETWTTANHPYIIQGSISISSSTPITVTVEPGVVVKFSSISSSLSVSSGNTLDVQGTTGSPVYFTSYYDDSAGGDTDGGGASSGSSGDWKHIQVNSGGTASFTNAVIRYGGCYTGTFGSCPSSSSSGANIRNNGTLNLYNASSTDAGVYGMVQEAGTTTAEYFEISDPSGYGFYITGGDVSLATSSIHDASYGLYTNTAAGNISIIDSTFYDNSSGAGFLNLGTGMTITQTGNTSTSGVGRGFYASGSITTSQTWSGDGLPYIISGNVTVPSGKKLTIDQGAIIKFSANSATFVVNGGGELDVQGTAESPVLFTSYKDDTAGGDTNGNGASAGSSGDWKHVKLDSGASTTLAYTGINYGGYLSGGGSGANIYNTGGTLNLEGSTSGNSYIYGIAQTSGTTTATGIEIANNTGGYGFYITGGDVAIASSTIHNNYTGLYLITAGNLEITASNIYSNAHDGIRQSSGTVTTTVTDSAIYDNGDYGAYSSFFSPATFIAENNYWGAWIAADLGKNTGPYHATLNPNGGGDTITSYIDFEPYTVAYLFDPADSDYSPPAVNIDALEMKWSSSTVYSTEWQNGINVWNSSTTGAVSISYIASPASADLLVHDVDDPLVIWSGLWVPGEEPPHILLNEDENRLGSASTEQIQCITTHELGHAVGLAHGVVDNIMYYDCTAGQVEPGTQDLHDHGYVWDNGYRWEN